MNTILRVLPYVRGHGLLVVAGLFLIILGALAQLLTGWPMKILVDNVLGEHPLPQILNFEVIGEDPFALLIWVVVGGVLVILLQNGLTVLRVYANTQLKLRITLDFRGDLFQHAQRLSLAYHDRNYSGKLVYILTNHANAASGLVMTLPVLAQSLLTFLGMFFIVLAMDAQLAVASLLVLPFLYRSVGNYATRVQSRLHQVKDLEGETLS